MTRTLLYGGSFDPPHLGHVHLSHMAMKKLSFDTVIFVPSFQSPLKEAKPTEQHHRLTMLELALKNCDWATISTLELERGGTSYTIDTVEALQGTYDELRLLLGSDQFEQFTKWHRWEEITTLANPAIMPRKGFETDDARLLHIDPLSATSTDIRALVRRGESIDALVHPEVAQYIAQNMLYL
jgi:nicotinate-nucleotide adenylyltransferase